MRAAGELVDRKGGGEIRARAVKTNQRRP